MMDRLSISQSHYIKAVYELSSIRDEGVRVMDIAENLGVSKASDSLAMSKLEKERLIKKDKKRQIYLTRKGEYHAVRMMDKCSIIQGFLTDIMDVDEKVAVKDACAMEHVISLDSLCAMCRIQNQSGNKKTCSSNCNAFTNIND